MMFDFSKVLLLLQFVMIYARVLDSVSVEVLYVLLLPLEIDSYCVQKLT